MEKIEHIVLPKDVAKMIVVYLMRRPYEEVYKIIPQITIAKEYEVFAKEKSEEPTPTPPHPTRKLSVAEKLPKP